MTDRYATYLEHLLAYCGVRTPETPVIPRTVIVRFIERALELYQSRDDRDQIRELTATLQLYRRFDSVTSGEWQFTAKDAQSGAYAAAFEGKCLTTFLLLQRVAEIHYEPNIIPRSVASIANRIDTELGAAYCRTVLLQVLSEGPAVPIEL